MRKRSGVGGLILATVSMIVVIAATLITSSRAAFHQAPSSGPSELLAESEFAPLSNRNSRPLSSRSSSSPTAAITHSAAGGGDTSAQVGVPTGPAESGGSYTTSDAAFEQLWYGQAHSAFAPIGGDSWSSPQSVASASGYGSSSNADAYRRRSAQSGGYAGASGGGYPSGGGGGASNPQSSLSSGSSSRAQVLSNAGTPDLDGEVPSLLPAQAIANLPQSNPLLGTGPAVGATSAFAPFRGTGSGGGLATGAALPSVGAGSTASVTQLQPVSVPEPSTVLLLGGGLALAAYRSRRKPTR